MYYKLGQVLQIRAIIKNWGIATCNSIATTIFYVVEENHNHNAKKKKCNKSVNVNKIVK